MARALVRCLEVCPEARKFARGEDIRRGAAYLLRQDMTGAADYFNRLMSPPGIDLTLLPAGSYVD